MLSAAPYFNIFFNSYKICPFWPFYWLLKKFDHLYDAKNNQDMSTCQQGRDVISDNPGDLFRNGSC